MASPVLDNPTSPVYDDADYCPLYSNWYAAKPYGFLWTPKDGRALPMALYLPIAPSNLTIVTHMAAAVTPTLYGTVEEHSPVRYYDITIEGTTGMGPKYVLPFAQSGTPMAPVGRGRFYVKSLISQNSLLAQSGLFKSTLNNAQQLVNQAKSLLNLSDGPSTGLRLDQTGYLAFHNLYRFLLKYKKDVSSSYGASEYVQDKYGTVTGREAAYHPLIFFNYKDNNQYKVVVKAFTMRRDAADPMMYHYGIQMRGYDLETAGQRGSSASLEALMSDLGLDGVAGATLMETIKKKAAQAKALLATLNKGINQLGQ